MKRGIRFSLAYLTLTHVLFVSGAGFCQAEYHTEFYSHTAPTHHTDTKSVYCGWACQVVSSSPTLAATPPRLNLPQVVPHECVSMAAQTHPSLALQILSPRAPPA